MTSSIQRTKSSVEDRKKILLELEERWRSGKKNKGRLRNPGRV